MFAPVKVTRPVPPWVTLPVPEITPAYVCAEPSSNVSNPLFVMSPNAFTLKPLWNRTSPAPIVVPPVWMRLPVRSSVAAPSLVTLPVPEMLPP